MGELRRKWIGTRKTAKRVVFLSFFLIINNPSFAKSLPKGLIMLFKPSTLSITLIPNPITPQTVRNVIMP